ncbi:U-box-domain-containing protein [Aureobasidium pullulans]|uniref:U-box-domain-containing protein n=1 Tax=Aureobasidium pullulans TaxID=5580 RepID=A0A4S8V9C7_AURPU|nr:U-box-domain-containing protein [Aureobasidium pullulans]THV97162.1 U-box-domain-containing protein [Aureobasidium pullulans]THW07999.1 U-box-domain-containing protein [Aureobasidium pullulans]THW41945.1 U-box-domain-containing protein [Aureobasidium pullulans]THW63167.1 U-box-domain-containing protein [Aureobasidium pullulans]
MAHLADKLKQEGNHLFKAGDYIAAEERYTAAITKFSRNPLIFTNRALARIRLQRWQGVLEDCLKSLEYTPRDGFNFKSYFYLAQAQLALHHPNEALHSALTAYNQAMHPPQAEATKAIAALPSLSELVLKCKKEKFAARERERRRKRGDILAELEENLETNKRNDLSDTEIALSQQRIGVIEAQERRAEILETHQGKLDELHTVFALADPQNHQAREVPDYLVDTISFEIMHDPVITRTGHSYERATLLEYLKNSPVDPLTREPLTAKDLRPNVALRQVLEEFWKTAGNWAIDW